MTKKKKKSQCDASQPYLSGTGADNVQSKASDTVDTVSGDVQPKGLTHFHGLWGRAENGGLPLCVQFLQMLPWRAADWLAAVTAGQLFL